MDLLKKASLKELFKDYKPQLLYIAQAISRNDPEVVKSVQFALDEPKKYFMNKAEHFGWRGIELDNDEVLYEYELKTDDLLFLMMVDVLEAHGYLVEVDFTCGYKDFLAALKTLKTYDLIADVMPNIDIGEISEDGDVEVWIEEINGVLDGKAYIYNNDIYSDRYPLIIVDRETFELLNSGDVEEQSRYETLWDSESSVGDGRRYGAGGSACDYCPGCVGSRDWCPYMD